MCLKLVVLLLEETTTSGEKPLIRRKSLTIFSHQLYRVHPFHDKIELTTLVVIETDCTGGSS